MRSVMRRLLTLSLLAATVPVASPVAPADEGPAEIRLGKAPPPAPGPDPVYARAVERFLAARQSMSVDRSLEFATRRWLAGGVKADAATLAGAPGQTLVAFDFSDAAIVRLEGGRFRVPVYLLFADRQGRVTESRDEVLTFTGGGGGTICASLKTASVMRWDSGEVVKSAARLHSREALDRAEESLRAWTRQQRRLAAYSIEDIFATGPATILIPCLRFTAEFGKRGYDVVDSPIMMRRGPRGYQIETAAN